MRSKIWIKLLSIFLSMAISISVEAAPPKISKERKGQDLKDAIKRKFNIEIAPENQIDADYLKRAEKAGVDLFHPSRIVVESIFYELHKIPERFWRRHTATAVYLIPEAVMPKDFLGQYDFQSHRLYITPQPFSSEVSLLFPHEWGHAVWGKMTDKQKEAYTNLSWEKKGLFQNWKRKDDAHFLTDYSKKNVDEDFAEHFRFYIDKADDLKEKAPEKFKFFEELFIGEGK